MAIDAGAKNIAAFILATLHSQNSSTPLLQSEYSGFDGFHKKKAEAPVELAIHICLLTFY